MPRSSVRTSALDDIGNPDAPPGSAAWATWFVRQTQKTRRDLESEASSLCKLLNDLERYEAWKPLGLASFSMLCARELDLSLDQVESIRGAKDGETTGIILGYHPGPLPGSMTKAARENAPISDNITNRCTDRGTGESYLKERLRIKHPDIFARFEAGEFKSVRAAALEAGIVEPSFQCPKNPAKAAVRLKRHFRGKCLAELVAALTRQD